MLIIDFVQYKTPDNYVLDIHCRQFAKSIPRNFTVKYDPYTQTVNLLNSKKQIEGLTKKIQWDIEFLQETMKKVTM